MTYLLRKPNMKERLKLAFGLQRVIQRFIAAWCALNFLVDFKTEAMFFDKSYAFEINVPIYAVRLLAIFFALTVLDVAFTSAHLDTYAMIGSFFLLSIRLLSQQTDNFWLYAALVCAFAVLLCFVLHNDLLHLKKLKIGSAVMWGFVAACGLCLAAIISAVGVLRYRTYSTPNFDFGLFCNMFHHMKTTLKQVSSSERGVLLSHFAVHISPVYYLALPVYALFPHPETLQVFQGIVIASGIIPFCLLARHLGISKKYICLGALVFGLNPVLISGTFYDFHENCFLVPFLLWMFYFYEKRKLLFMYLAMLLVWTVKEDAPLFTLFFGAFLFLSKKDHLHGVIVGITSAMYFIIAMGLLIKFGEGTMDGRFANYMYEGNGLVGMAKIMITDPGYVFTQILNEGKLIYLLKILLPLGFLPLAGRKVSRLIILVPFFVENIMTDYVYQYSIDFQYTFGAFACMLYLALLNRSEMGEKASRYLCLLAAGSTVLLFTMTGAGKLTSLSERYSSGKAEYESMNETLESIPDNCSVSCSTFLLAHLADRSEVYELSQDVDADIVVLDERPALHEESQPYLEKYLEKGYSVIEENKDKLTVLASGDFIDPNPAPSAP